MQRTVAKRWATQLGCLVMMTVLVSGCDQQNRGTPDSSTSTPAYPILYPGAYRLCNTSVGD